MQPLYLTHPQGICLPMNPLCLVTWGPFKGKINTGTAEAPSEIDVPNGTAISCSDGQVRIVTEPPALVSLMWSMAVQNKPVAPIDTPMAPVAET